MRNLQTVSLLGATITTGLMAGLFAAFSYAVMPGLHRTDDATFVASMQQINKAIINGWFVICFLGALVLTALAAIAHLRDHRRLLPWILAALVLYIAMLVVTGTVNVPLNDRLADYNGRSSHAARNMFENRWVAWNLARAVTTTVAFGLLAWALVLHGRASRLSNPATPSPAAVVEPAAMR